LNVCGLASNAEAAAALGQPVVSSRATGPERDDDTGGQLSYCTYRASKAGLVLTVVEFASPAAARKVATAEFAKSTSDNAQITIESGIGERTFWVQSARGGGYMFLKGSRVVQVSAGGAGQAPQRKAAMRALASAVARKL
ncbi:hypothetical protein, partial [Staphylococcus aureus]